MAIFLWILKLIIAALPGVMLGLPVWAVVIIFGILSTIPIPFGSEIYWAIGLIGALSGPQDGFAVSYYLLTILPIISTVIRIKSKNNNF